MADILLSALNKSNKTPLPPGWIERTSKKHPDQPFYFNISTGETTWSPPLHSEDKVKNY